MIFYFLIDPYSDYYLTLRMHRKRASTIFEHHLSIIMPSQFPLAMQQIDLELGHGLLP